MSELALQDFEARRRLAEYFKNESKRELEYAEKLRATSERSQNPVVKLIMDAVSQDSIKHSKIYETMASIIQGAGLIDQAESSAVLNDIESHIKMEKESIDELEKLKNDNMIKSDPALTFLIDMLLRDESFHHALLTQIYNAIIKNITLSEQEIWDAVWRDATYHGTPGG
ncbi:hypothetical protein ASAC_1286 [Acidilobus saccharovorans 345-15]|uniref:Rubrerythrin diiron-binding domain-containing protein n=1 Tax=Acidilobus saccharovorans (strain DSM 16705 / JCM 18335 / VKM B-2471 / 345-15) TaxID=666510 RepID=D9Q303_ACIS3|nr:hypothetical protein ASAC_1286 [Acidilobus saccharovorans 345-15]